MAVKMSPVAPLEASIAARARFDAISAAFPMSGWLPTRNVASLDYEFDASGKRSFDLAEFRAFDTEASYGRDNGGITKEGKLPPISRSRLIGELTELQLQNASDAVLHDTIITYVEGLADAIALRLEYAKAEGLRTGKLVLSENGLTATIDYGRDPSLTVVTGGTGDPKKWSDAAATPTADIESWRKLVAAQTTYPTAALLTLDVMEALSKSPDVIRLAVQRTTDIPARIPYDQVRGVLASFGLSTVTVIDEASSQFALPSPLFPAGTFLLLPAPAAPVFGTPFGETKVGIPAESLNAEYAIPAARRSGVFAGAFTRENPEGIFVLASAIALPVIERSNATLAATVL